MIVRRERPADIPAISTVHDAAFKGDPAAESGLVTALRADPGWIPQLSLVAEDADGSVVGHVVCTRAWLDDVPVVGLGPLGVLPARQTAGVGSALMHAVLGAADALDVPLVGLLGNPAYYSRFGFVAASRLGIEAPEPRWGDHFQARPLATYRADLRGRFRYAPPFDAV